VKTFTCEEIKEILDPQFWAVVNGWIGRGDGVAVYRNQAMDSIVGGERQFVSYGSHVCQLEMSEDKLPTRLPDMGGAINWAYQLEGVYHGRYLIPEKETPDFKREVIGVQLPPDLWERIQPPRCDLCNNVAQWRHPKGGLRCRKCPRPNE
jgi:hypothetical protein